MLSSYSFDCPLVITLVQSLVTIVLLVIMKRSGSLKFEDLKMETIYKVFPLAIIFLFYVVISLSALGAVNLPMFTGLRYV